MLEWRESMKSVLISIKPKWCYVEELPWEE